MNRSLLKALENLTELAQIHGEKEMVFTLETIKAAAITGTKTELAKHVSKYVKATLEPKIQEQKIITQQKLYLPLQP